MVSAYALIQRQRSAMYAMLHRRRYNVSVSHSHGCKQLWKRKKRRKKKMEISWIFSLYLVLQVNGTTRNNNQRIDGKLLCCIFHFLVTVDTFANAFFFIISFTLIHTVIQFGDLQMDFPLIAETIEFWLNFVVFWCDNFCLKHCDDDNDRKMIL